MKNYFLLLLIGLLAFPMVHAQQADTPQNKPALSLAVGGNWMIPNQSLYLIDRQKVATGYNFDLSYTFSLRKKWRLGVGFEFVRSGYFYERELIFPSELDSNGNYTNDPNLPQNEKHQFIAKYLGLDFSLRYQFVQRPKWSAFLQGGVEPALLLHRQWIISIDELTGRSGKNSEVHGVILSRFGVGFNQVLTERIHLTATSFLRFHWSEQTNLGHVPGWHYSTTQIPRFLEVNLGVSYALE